MHLAVDEKRAGAQGEMNQMYDSRLGEALIQGDEQGYFADRAYDSQALRETLERRGLVDGIVWKVKHPLSARDLADIPQCLDGSVRSAVERAFATMKRWYGMGRVAIWGSRASASQSRSPKDGWDERPRLFETLARNPSREPGRGSDFLNLHRPQPIEKAQFAKISASKR